MKTFHKPIQYFRHGMYEKRKLKAFFMLKGAKGGCGVQGSLPLAPQHFQFNFRKLSVQLTNGPRIELGPFSSEMHMNRPDGFMLGIRYQLRGPRALDNPHPQAPHKYGQHKLFKSADKNRASNWKWPTIN